MAIPYIAPQDNTRYNQTKISVMQATDKAKEEYQKMITNKRQELAKIGINTKNMSDQQVQIWYDKVNKQQSTQISTAPKRSRQETEQRQKEAKQLYQNEQEVESANELFNENLLGVTDWIPGLGTFLRAGASDYFKERGVQDLANQHALYGVLDGITDIPILDIAEPVIKTAAKTGREAVTKAALKMNQLSNRFKPRYHGNYNWSFGSNPSIMYQIQPVAGANVPISVARRPFRVNKELLQKEAEKIVEDLSTTRPFLSQQSTSSNPAIKEAAKQEIESLEKVAKGDFIMPETLVVDPEEAAEKIVLPVIGSIDGANPLVKIDPTIDLAIAFRNKFPTREVTLRDGTKKLNVGTMVHGFRGVDSKRDPITKKKIPFTIFNPNETSRKYYHQTFATSPGTAYGAVYYTGLGKNGSESAITKYWGNSTKNKDLQIQLNELTNKWVKIASEKGLAPKDIHARLPLFIEDPADLIKYIELNRQLQHSAGLERGPVGGVFELAGSSRGNTMQFNWQNGDFDDITTGKLIKGKTVEDPVTHNTKAIKGVNELNKIYNDNISEPTDLIGINNIVDGNTYFPSGEQFTNIMNDLIYGRNNWVVSKYKFGGKLNDN